MTVGVLVGGGGVEEGRSEVTERGVEESRPVPSGGMEEVCRRPWV